MARIGSALLLAGGLVCFVFAAVLAIKTKSLDLSILDIYFVVSPRYLVILGTFLILASLAAWKALPAR